MSKKLLLTVAALAAASSAVAAEAKSAAPSNSLSVTLGGSMDSQIGAVRQSEAFDYSTPVSAPTSTSAKLGQYGTVNDTKVNVGVKGSAKGLNFGGSIVLNADSSANVDGSSQIAQSTSVFVESPVGKVELGSMLGASSVLSESTQGVATGGASAGDWNDWVNSSWVDLASGTAATAALVSNTNGRFIMEAALPGDYVNNPNAVEQGYANKVSLYTPSWNGLKFGVSFTPDTGVKGTTASFDAENIISTNNIIDTAANAHVDADLAMVGFRNVWSGGAHYSHSLGHKTHAKVSVLGQSGDAKNVNNYGTLDVRHKLSAFEVAGSVDYMGLNVSASYGSLGKSGQLSTANGNVKSYYWTAGLGYEHGPLGASLTYFKSERGGDKTSGAALAAANVGQKDKAEVYSLGLQYQVAQGLLPYAELSSYKLTQARTATANAKNVNKGSVVLVGTKLFF
jgi:hypothetical protein